MVVVQGIRPTPLENLVIGKEYLFEKPRLNRIAFDNEALNWDIRSYCYRPLHVDEVNRVRNASTIKLIGRLSMIEMMPHHIAFTNVRMAFLEPQKRDFEKALPPGVEIIYPNRDFTPNNHLNFFKDNVTFYEYNPENALLFGGKIRTKRRRTKRKRTKRRRNSRKNK